MGRKFAPDEASSFYPPRARWYAAVFRLGDALRRHVYADKLRMPKGTTVPGFVVSFLVPGAGYYLRGPRFWGYVAFASCAALFATYWIWLGYPAANWALGLMMSIHSSSFVYYCSPLVEEESFRSRMMFTLGASLAVMVALYWPVKEQLQAHWLSPLRVNGRVIVVSRAPWSGPVHRGDWVAFSLYKHDSEEYEHGYVYIHNGTCLGEVLGMAGDTVTFERGRFSVNGVWRPSLEHMPRSGTMVVAENHWFIWPNLVMNGGHGNVSPADIATAVLGLASVSPEQFLGRPFERWFWREQIIK